MMSEAEKEVYDELARRDNLAQKEKPQTAVYSGSELIQKKKEELDLRRLEIEIERLQKPDTSIDYYSKMLELQKESFKAQLDMIAQQSQLKIEIEKLKLGDKGSDFAEEFLYGLLPLLPEIVKQNQAKKAKEGQEMNAKKAINLMNAKEVEEYKLKIKAGAVSLDEAWEDFQKSMPQMKGKITKEQFSVEYEKIKNSPK